jgi:hypothetical protein
MAHSDDGDSFPAEVQLDMFGAPPAPIPPDLDELREELAGILTQVRDASREPLDTGDVAHFRNIFSRMAGRLPADESDQLLQELEAELARRVSA